MLKGRAKAKSVHSTHRQGRGTADAGGACGEVDWRAPRKKGVSREAKRPKKRLGKGVLLTAELIKKSLGKNFKGGGPRVCGRMEQR